MQRVVVLGPGGAGKSAFARRLGSATGLPVIELDAHFWRPGPTPTPAGEWEAVQRGLVAGEAWIIDGDLGPYDQLPIRLEASDTVVVLDLPLVRCAWRAVRRSRENLEFWRWLLSWRRRYRPLLLRALTEHAGSAQVHLLRRPAEVEALLAGVEQRGPGRSGSEPSESV